MLAELLKKAFMNTTETDKHEIGIMLFQPFQNIFFHMGPNHHKTCQLWDIRHIL